MDAVKYIQIYTLLVQYLMIQSPNSICDLYVDPHPNSTSELHTSSHCSVIRRTSFAKHTLCRMTSSFSLISPCIHHWSI